MLKWMFFNGTLIKYIIVLVLYFNTKYVLNLKIVYINRVEVKFIAYF